MPTKPSKTLETFPNPNSERDYIIQIETPEFTCLCPKTGQPDFATFHLEYVPDRLCVELKSLKLYLWSYRDEGAFHEKVTNTVAQDLVTATEPRYLRLTMQFNVRGGLYTTVVAEHRKPGWKNPPPPPEGLPRESQTLPGRDEVTPEPKPADTAAAKSTTAAPTKAAATNAPAPASVSGSQRFRMLRRTRAPAVAEAEPAAAPVSQEPAAPPPPPKPTRPEPVYLGIDLGSTGCRAVAINQNAEIVAQSEAPIPAATKKDNQFTQDPTRWWNAVSDCLESIMGQIDPRAVRAIAVDGTSGTMLLADERGGPVTPAIMYKDQRATEQAKRIATVAGPDSGALGATSTLAKLLWLQDRKLDARAAHLLHQADWVSGRLSGLYGHSDYNNCLKLGFDVESMQWPGWLAALAKTELLPKVHAPGEVLGKVSSETAKTFGLDPATDVVAGTTDGVAAFLAAGGSAPGHAVTSLGSTLVLKLLSNKPVFSPSHGVYSHRLGRYWLAGGASNSGGAVLLQYFKVEQMREMTPLLDPENPTGLDYYPLPDVGERFPVNDPHMNPRLEPLPPDSVTFFQGILEGIGQIEAEGYRLLTSLGAPKLAEVRTTGGGAQNPAWTRIRERILGVRITPARSGAAAYGAALLAAGVLAKTFQ
jgi:7-cyano-7-deazaguanine reductase